MIYYPVMRIFYGFIILLAAAILFSLPVSEAVQDYRTDLQTDTTFVQTPAGGNATVVLRTAIYAADTSSVSFSSDYPTDVPALVSYNATNRQVTLTGLDAAANRTLQVEYDVDALNANVAIGTFMDKLAWIWLICIFGFAPASIAAMFIKRA